MEHENTLGQIDTRGIYFRYPEHLSLKIMPVTSIDGYAQKSSKVSLFVNGKFIKEIKIDESEQYRFDNIRLRIKRLNILKVIIEREDGSKKEIIKKVAASKRILEKGTKEIELNAGKYKKQNISEWQGEMFGIKTSSALTENLSLSLEGGVYTKEEDQIYSAADLGLAFRTTENSIITLDWLTVGEDNGSSEQGAEVSYLYTLENGYLEALYLNIPDEIEKGMIRDQGREREILGVWELSPTWTVKSKFGNYQSLDPDVLDEEDYLEVNFEKSVGWQSFTSIGARYEKKYSEYTIATNNNHEIEIPGTNKRLGFNLERSIYKKGFKGSGELSVFDNDVVLENDLKLNFQNFTADLELYKKVTSPLLLTNITNISVDKFDSGFENFDYETSFKLRYLISDNSTLSLKGKKSDLNTEDTQEEDYTIELSHYFNNNLNANIGLTNSSSSNSVDYNSYNLGLAYYFPENEGNLNLYFDYVVPEKEQLTDQQSYGLLYSKVLAEERELELTLGKDYNGFLSDNSEYFFTISVSQAFGFAGDNILPQRFDNNRHQSFVAGYVYLDENNNGKMDEGEKRLSGIKMKLENIRTKTNEEGFYRFNPMMSGLYILDFDYNNLNADYTPVTGEKLINLRKNENMFFNYGVTINGSISGKVFMDENNNGKMDETEEPLSWVGVLINDKQRTDYTDKRGEFYFENVPLGEYEITLLVDSLPAFVVPDKGFTRVIKVTEDGLDHNIVIPLKYDY